MKGLVLVALFVLSVGAVNSGFSMEHFVKVVYQQKMRESVGELNECKLCLDVVDNVINDVLNIFLNAGVAATCQTGCADIAQRFFNGSEFEQIVDVLCTFGCVAVGIDEFVKILEKIDIDPIYYCEELKACPINDNGKAKIDKLAVSPLQAAQGSTFDVEIDYTVINTTGTADILMIIHTIDKVPVEGEFMLFQQKPSGYQLGIKVDTTPNPDCQICEEWLKGTYIIDIYLCEGQCHSKHPHHKIYDVKHANFTITGP